MQVTGQLQIKAHTPRSPGPLHWNRAGCRNGRPLRAAEPEASVSITFQQKDVEPVTISCPSGEQLRATMLDNKVDLYTTWGKVWQCGGVGQCGTCIVQVEEGAELLSEKTETELKKLKGKSASWRLACQTIVGGDDGTLSGSITIKTKP